jgi:hypothetical protein
MRGGTIGILYFYSIPFYGPRHSLSLALLRLFGCFFLPIYDGIIQSCKGVRRHLNDPLRRLLIGRLLHL